MKYLSIFLPPAFHSRLVLIRLDPNRFILDLNPPVIPPLESASLPYDRADSLNHTIQPSLHPLDTRKIYNWQFVREIIKSKEGKWMRRKSQHVKSILILCVNVGQEFIVCGFGWERKKLQRNGKTFTFEGAQQLWPCSVTATSPWQLGSKVFSIPSLFHHTKKEARNSRHKFFLVVCLLVR